MKLIDFFKPSWKKLYWLFIVYLMSEIYSALILGSVPSSITANFVSFVLNPATTILTQMKGVEMELVRPFASTLDLVWMYIVATILAKEVSKDKE